MSAGGPYLWFVRFCANNVIGVRRLLEVISIFKGPHFFNELSSLVLYSPPTTLTTLLPPQLHSLFAPDIQQGELLYSSYYLVTAA